MGTGCEGRISNHSAINTIPLAHVVANQRDIRLEWEGRTMHQDIFTL